MLTGKRFFSFVDVQVSFVSRQIVEFLLTSVAFIWTDTLRDRQGMVRELDV